MDMKAQSAMEYVAIVGIVMIIMVPAAYLYVRYSGDSSDSVVNAKIDSIGNEIISSAEQVYSYGEESQKTIELSFPNGIEKVEFINNEIIFHTINSKGNTNEIAKVSNVNLTGVIVADFEGRKEVIIRSLGNSVSVQTSCNKFDITCQPCYFEGYGSYYCTYECLNQGGWSQDSGPYEDTECLSEVTHNVCSDYQCVPSSGLGEDECQINDECANPQT
ncbi:hypothetical protein J4425_02855 [Candidatus Woesearchaeota archaeon]|nr:hypothetical protein [Candidatus Woesearchaeota archaeon]